MTDLEMALAEAIYEVLHGRTNVGIIEGVRIAKTGALLVSQSVGAGSVDGRLYLRNGVDRPAAS